ncbi:MBL fold metallo-hydrolase [Phytohabitans flavus]|uniref:MBL fold metallo-hydrolase n=1 Tax=Phytohabitans flavus TaxID=1076124 RepID=UPI0036255A9B
MVGTPYFPNATYLLQRADAEAFDRPEIRRRLLGPLTDAGQLRLVEGDVPIAAGVTAIATPGHTPGHQSVLIGYGERQLLITGDLLVHVVQLVAPDTAYAHEMDPEAARNSRTKLLKAGITLATPHLSEPFLPA